MHSVIVLCFVVRYVHSSFSIILMGKRELFVFLVSRDCCVTLPRSAMDLSAVCDISWSYSLAILNDPYN